MSLSLSFCNYDYQDYHHVTINTTIPIAITDLSLPLLNLTTAIPHHGMFLIQASLLDTDLDTNILASKACHIGMHMCAYMQSGRL